MIQLLKKKVILSFLIIALLFNILLLYQFSYKDNNNSNNQNQLLKNKNIKNNEEIKEYFEKNDGNEKLKKNINFIKQYNIDELIEISSWNPEKILQLNKENSIISVPEICKEKDLKSIQKCEGENYYIPIITPSPVSEDSSKLNYSLRPNSEFRAKYSYYQNSYFYKKEYKPIISILTAYYNIKTEYLDEAAQSIFKQSLQSFEWIIINDGSSNKTLASLSLNKYKELSKKDPRIKVIDLEKNIGLPGARNEGLKISTGKYIISVDPDDSIENTYFEKAVWFLETHQNFTLLNGWTIIFGNRFKRWKGGFHRYDNVLYTNYISIATVMRTNVLKELGGFNESLKTGMEDWDLWIKMANNSHWGYTMEEFQFWYRGSPRGKWESHDNITKYNEYKKHEVEKYTYGYMNGVPRLIRPEQGVMESIKEEIPFENEIKKCRSRILFIFSKIGFGDDLDKFHFNLIKELVLKNWEVSIVVLKNTVNSWIPHFARATPDLFILPRFLENSDYCRFLVYLIKSRQFDIVFISNSELAYQFLPYLRSNAPGPSFVDFNLFETPKWKNGGYARYSTGFEILLDRSIFGSENLRQYSIKMGHNLNKTATILNGIDNQVFKFEKEFCDAAIVSQYSNLMFTNEIFSKLSKEIATLGNEYWRTIKENFDFKKQSLKKEIVRIKSPYPDNQPEQVYKNISCTNLRFVSDILFEKQTYDKKMKVVLKDYQEEFKIRNPKFANKNIKPNGFLGIGNHGVQDWNKKITFLNPQQEYIAYISNSFISSGDSGTIYDWERIFLLKNSKYEMFNLPPNEKCDLIKLNKVVSLLQFNHNSSFGSFLIDQLPRLSIVLEEILLDKEIKIIVPKTEYSKVIMEENLKIPKERLVYHIPDGENCTSFYAETILLPTPSIPGNPSRESLTILREFFYKQNNLSLTNNITYKSKHMVIYCSRVKSKGNRILNENEIIETIKNSIPVNFELYIWDGSENLNSTILNIASRAKVIIGTTGSNLAPILFAKPKTIVVEFIPQNPKLSYWSASASLQLEHWMVPIIGYGHDKQDIPISIEELNNTLNIIFRKNK